MAGISDHVDAAFAACPAGALGFVYDYSTAKFSTDPAKFTLPEVIEARGVAERLVADWCGLALYRADPVQQLAAEISQPFLWSYHRNEPSLIAKDLGRAEVREVGRHVARLVAPHRIDELAKQGGAEVMVIVGGVIPAQDYEFLKKIGVAAIYGPGTNIPAAAAEILGILRQRSQKRAA